MERLKGSRRANEEQSRGADIPHETARGTLDPKPPLADTEATLKPLLADTETAHAYRATSAVG